MGIKNLTKLLGDHAPGCCREQKIDNYFGRRIAIDASMHIYQFLVVVGRTGDQTLTSESGDVTSHLQGMFFRTAKMLEVGMKPVYVFDGKPPALKKEELSRRVERRGDATDQLTEAKETGGDADIEKYSKRTVRVTAQHNEECRTLLRLMGVPVIEAPSEAEAQCAQMCKEGLVYGIASEDMDSLTFATPKLVRNLMKPQTQNLPINEYDYDKVLEGLSLTSDQFVDLCILCGCDYCGTIKGIGGVTALKLIQKHETLERVLESMRESKYQIPDPFPFEEARRLFKEPDVLRGEKVQALKWVAADEEGLVKFLVGEKSFNEDRVRKAVQRVNAAKSKSTQGRLESFFGSVTTKKSDTGKRKEPEKSRGKPGAPAKKGKSGIGKK
ncbi:Elongation of fatty acids protein 2 [Coccomyxa viridis]|uniref:Flap endonuclease 1 n=1 Tax=Coccomyxa viridis TaxID=1274662 RepID=A0AAV1IBG6_9CHLO|nr:Elongation of fatty acids protein 2 [Coccomyxa viridis]